MQRNVIETVMGAVVLMVAAGFTYIAYQSGNVATANGYVLSAKFDRVDGLVVGSDVRISGLKVGSVVKQHIDPESYLAVVTVNVDDTVRLPKDSSAEIVSDGLLGNKYLALVPGGAEDMLENEDEIQFTQSSVNLEQLLGKVVFGSADDDKDNADNGQIPADNDAFGF